MPVGKLACSRCFEVKPFNKKNFDMDNYRVEPVCNTCRKIMQDTSGSPEHIG